MIFSPKSKNGFRRLSNRDYGYLILNFSIQSHSKVFSSELKKTLECDILNPDRIINLEIKMRGEQAIFNLEIKKKSGLSLNPDIHHSKVFSSGDIESYADNK